MLRYSQVWWKLIALVINLLAEVHLQVLLQLLKSHSRWISDVRVCVGTLTFQVPLLIALQETIHHPVRYGGCSRVLLQLKQKPLWHNSAVKELVVF